MHARPHRWRRDFVACDPKRRVAWNPNRRSG
jgi:hypothetical protein